MKATYCVNKEKNGIEIYFEKKPSEDIRNQLKIGKWRWSKTNKCWYNKNTARNIEFAQYLCSDRQNPVNNKTNVETSEILHNKKEIQIPTNSSIIDLSKIEKGQKLSKAIFVRNQSREELFGIKTVSLVAFKGNEYPSYCVIEIKGEILGHTISNDSFIIILCAHNDNNEPVSCTTLNTVYPRELNDGFSFETVLYIPEGELLSDITIQPTGNPSIFA